MSDLQATINAVLFLAKIVMLLIGIYGMAEIAMKDWTK